MRQLYYGVIFVFISITFFYACEEEEYTVPEAKTEFQNDCIKRSITPNITGQNIEFVYAMALGEQAGKITSAQVEASIVGATGTYLENNSYYTNTGGADVPVLIGNPSVTNGVKTEVVFTKDTCAAALRYYYKIPEEARGREVSFTFSAKASTGETVSYKMGPYSIRKMDMKLDLVLSDNNKMYFSIADMAVYDATEAVSNAAKIDLVYLYRAITGITFAHALVSPASDVEYLPGVTLPSGVNNSTKFVKVYSLRDQQLARLQYGIFIDDADFEKADFTNAPNYGINMKLDAGAWLETADGKYRAYIFINKVDNTKKEMTVSIKRYAMK